MHTDQDKSRLRGRSAIEAAHIGIAREDEARLDAAISNLYGVGGDEAAEIHTNYHLERIFSSLEKRARASGMKRETLIERARHLDLQGVAYQVAKGQLAEAAAVDVLYRNLTKMESRGSADDRYVNFYG